jgi:hypothetical protein
MPKTPSLCLDDCKFKRHGHSIGFPTTKGQKSMFKILKTNGRGAGSDALLILQLAKIRYA